MRLYIYINVCRCIRILLKYINADANNKLCKHPHTHARARIYIYATLHYALYSQHYIPVTIKDREEYTKKDHI